MMLSGKNASSIHFEKVPYCSETSIALDLVRGPVLDCRCHYHPEIEFTFVVSGFGHVLLGTKLLPFRPGDLALIGPNVPHFYLSTPAEDPEAFSETRVLKIGGLFFGSGLLTLPEFASIKRLFDELQSVTLFENNPEFLADFDRLAAASNPERMLLCLEFLLRLAAAPRRELPALKDAPPSHDADRELIEKVIRIMQKRFREKLTLPEVAAAVRMEPESFRRFFRRTVRAAFSDYLIELRLNYAGRLLRESSRSVSEIALESGFRNLSNFNRLFRTRRNLSPREYRKLH